MATAFAVASCKRGERCHFLSYEESEGQLIQNMSSIGFHLKLFIKKGLLKIVSIRLSFFGLEMHLLDIYKLIAEFKPKAVDIDPLKSLIGEGDPREIRSMITLMNDLLKSNRITSFFTSLVSSAAQNDNSGKIGVSSLIDTWIVVRELEENISKKRIRGLFIVKSRGTGHESDTYKLILSNKGIKLLPMNGESTAIANKEKNTGKNVTEGKKLAK